MNPPERVYLVKRIPPPTEKKKYYSTRMSRIYRSKAHAQTFLKANKTSDFEIFEGVVSEWNKVELDD